MIHATLPLFCRQTSHTRKDLIFKELLRVTCNLFGLDKCQWLSYNLPIIRLQHTSVNTLKLGLQMADGEPCFSFGVIADIQYADTEDGYNYSQTNRRYYRTSIKMLDKAIDMWKNDSVKQPQFVLQLGDIIDGRNKQLGISDSSLEAVLSAFSNFPRCVYHIWGNHEYYNFTREALMKSKLYSGNDAFCLPVSSKCYYSCVPHPKLRILALDTYEVSMLASVENTPEHQLATEYMVNNENVDKNSSDGLTGVMRRFVKFNGAVSAQQLEWIHTNLDEARTLQQNVVIMGHCGIFEAATDCTCLCWNASAILQLVNEYSDCVLCYFSGHDHAGGVGIDEQGILHMAFPGVLENNVDSDFGTVYMYTDKMDLQGNGRVASLSLPLKFRLNEECISS